MRKRIRPVGSKKIIRQRVVNIRKQKSLTQATLLAKLQVLGLDISKTILVEIEAQQRCVYDREIPYFASALSVKVSTLLPDLSDRSD